MLDINLELAPLCALCLRLVQLQQLADTEIEHHIFAATRDTSTWHLTVDLLHKRAFACSGEAIAAVDQDGRPRALIKDDARLCLGHGGEPT